MSDAGRKASRLREINERAYRQSRRGALTFVFASQAGNSVPPGAPAVVNSRSENSPERCTFNLA